MGCTFLQVCSQHCCFISPSTAEQRVHFRTIWALSHFLNILIGDIWCHILTIQQVKSSDIVCGKLIKAHQFIPFVLFSVKKLNCAKTYQ